MKSFLLKWAAVFQAFLLPYGAWGLLGMSFLDSSFLPLPEVIDLWVMTLCWRNPAYLPLFAGAATLGSVAGYACLYALARRGGHPFLERKVGKARSDRIRTWFERYEFLTVMVPAILPPPTPLKAFIITAGVVEVHPGKFLLALVIGRGIRFFGEGFVAVRYGHAAWRWLQLYGPRVGLALLLAILVGLLVARATARRQLKRERGIPANGGECGMKN